MNPYMAYDAVNTKIHARKRHILNDIDWDKMLEYSTVDQIKNYLTDNSEFKNVLESVKNSDINRERLEAVLGKFKSLEMEDLIHYFSGPYKDFIKVMLLESEIADLSLILRKIARQESLEGIEDRFIHSEKFTSIQFNKLIESKNVIQFTEGLKGTPYYSELRNLTNEDAIKREFHIEMKLHIIFYSTLIAEANNLKKDDMEIAKDIIGFKIDLMNVQWISRARNYYKISPEEILNYSLRDGKNITYSRLKQLSYAKTDKEFNELVKSYFKRDFFGEIYDSYNNVPVCSYMINYLKKNNYKGIGSVISYYYLLSIIIVDLTTITEGITYNMSRDKLKEILACRF
ncbi:MAG: V-type ATPase subunit [Sedimentibacter sp.]|uniref:V-type ATPase subunit n=1 Tax=Sedimentibacter sp. TaxID=1960295 RepID=UPI002981E3CE|nr:V-type ATPase subunit [Sedimentibacter sp.]MDW5300264.1 V-type ATPase subunit [Sedimentibacter sp.]